jgi:hypothetical protein
MIITQLVRADILARLTESQLAILNSVVEAEIIQNASIRRQLGSSVKSITQSLQGAQAESATSATKSAGSKKSK